MKNRDFKEEKQQSFFGNAGKRPKDEAQKAGIPAIVGYLPFFVCFVRKCAFDLILS